MNDNCNANAAWETQGANPHDEPIVRAHDEGSIVNNMARVAGRVAGRARNLGRSPRPRNSSRATSIAHTPGVQTYPAGRPNTLSHPTGRVRTKSGTARNTTFVVLLPSLSSDALCLEVCSAALVAAVLFVAFWGRCRMYVFSSVLQCISVAVSCDIMWVCNCDRAETSLDGGRHDCNLSFSVVQLESLYRAILRAKTVDEQMLFPSDRDNRLQGS